jgi:hypothetical protein
VRDQLVESMIVEPKGARLPVRLVTGPRRDPHCEPAAGWRRALLNDSKIRHATHTKLSYPKSPARGAPGWPNPEPAGGLGVKGGTPAAANRHGKQINQGEFLTNLRDR